MLGVVHVVFACGGWSVVVTVLLPDAKLIILNLPELLEADGNMTQTRWTGRCTTHCCVTPD